MALNPARIDAAFYGGLREHYSDQEIIELGAFIGFNIGYHTFFGTLKFYPMFAPDGRLVTQEESARIYGDVPVSLQSAGGTGHSARLSHDLASSASPRHPDVSFRDPGVSLRHSGVSFRHSGESRNPEHPANAATVAKLARPVEPVPLENIEDPDLKRFIARGIELGVPDARFSTLLAHSPNHAKAVLHALIHSHSEGDVDHRLKEIIRIQLARIAGDRYFAALRSRRAIEAGLDEETIEAGGRGFASDGRFDAAWRWALQYAHTLYREPERIDAIFYAEGKRYWSEAQIMELGAFIALHYGMQAFMRTLHTA
jgi:alkylhydroperoxidase family enzyme